MLSVTLGYFPSEEFCEKDILELITISNNKQNDRSVFIVDWIMLETWFKLSKDPDLANVKKYDRCPISIALTIKFRILEPLVLHAYLDSIELIVDMKLLIDIFNVFANSFGADK